MCGEFLLTCGHLNVSALPSTWNNSNAAHGALINCCDYLHVDTVYFHSVCYRWCGLGVSVCDLGTLVVESRVKMEPTGLSVWPDARPDVSLLPGQRGRQSGASGVFWSLGLTESSLQDKTHNLIWFMLIFPYYFQIQSTFGCSTDSSTLCLITFYPQAAATNSGCWIPEYLKRLLHISQCELLTFRNKSHLSWLVLSTLLKELTSNLDMKSPKIPKKASVLVDLLSSPK